jgi:hypothetical protein
MKMLNRAMRSPATSLKRCATVMVIATVRANNGEDAPTLPRIRYSLKGYIRAWVNYSLRNM